jgi:hypothetical protein
MITPADSVIITITDTQYTIEAYADRTAIASQSTEITEHGQALARSGDDLFDMLPIDLAVSLDSMELSLVDAVLAIAPEAAA